MRRSPSLYSATLVLLATCAVAGSAGRARADDTTPRAGRETHAPPAHLRGELGTDVPVDLGGRIAFEGPLRLRASLTIGYLPSAYTSAMNSVLVGLHAYDSTTGTLIENGLGSSFVFRAHGGWKPFPAYGFYVDAGYGSISLDGGASAADILFAATKQPLPPGIPANDSFAMHSVLHMVDAEIGWETLLDAHITLRVALGGAFTVGSTTDVEPNFSNPPRAALAPYLANADAAINHVYRTYVFTPVVSFSMGWQIF
jgi:hypothetical protein